MYDAFAAYQRDKEFEAWLIAQQNKTRVVSVWLETSEKKCSEEIEEVLKKEKN